MNKQDSELLFKDKCIDLQEQLIILLKIIREDWPDEDTRSKITDVVRDCAVSLENVGRAVEYSRIK